MTYAELEQFFEGLIVRLREHGVACAITSGMACVHFGVASTTRDCDALCAPESADRCLTLLSETRLAEALPIYRGHLSPPLDCRWLRGGWTSHFVWRAGKEEAYLDLFGLAPRASTPWNVQLSGLYANRHIVAEMKRTDRAKDWPFITALGMRMLQSLDQRGWLHIFDAEVLLAATSEKPVPSELFLHRPILRLAVERDPRLEAALHAEIQFWHQLDRVRIRVYEQAIRPYLVAVRNAQISPLAPLLEQHEIRLRCAQAQLPPMPMVLYGLDRLISGAHDRTRMFANPEYMQWLPDVREHFISLVS